MTPLRQRFIEDLQLRNRVPKTIEAYVLQVRKFAQFYGRSPEYLNAEQVHRYLLYLLHEKKASWVQYNHAVVPGGGLSPDGTKWVSSRANFLVSVKVLGRLFRGKYLAAVKELYEAGELRFAGSTAAFAEKPAFQAWLSGLYAKD